MEVPNGQQFSTGMTQGPVLGPLFFLAYINDLVDNVNYDIKMFVNDTSLFPHVDDPVRSALLLNKDLEMVKLWGWQLKMHFNAEKTEEVIFSCKILKPNHPSCC